jgi:hypothetical protein
MKNPFNPVVISWFRIQARSLVQLNRKSFRLEEKRNNNIKMKNVNNNCICLALGETQLLPEQIF